MPSQPSQQPNGIPDSKSPFLPLDTRIVVSTKGRAVRLGDIQRLQIWTERFFEKLWEILGCSTVTNDVLWPCPVLESVLDPSRCEAVDSHELLALKVHDGNYGKWKCIVVTAWMTALQLRETEALNVPARTSA